LFRADPVAGFGASAQLALFILAEPGERIDLVALVETGAGDMARLEERDDRRRP
jgi:hypothetical protein